MFQVFTALHLDWLGSSDTWKTRLRGTDDITGLSPRMANLTILGRNDKFVEKKTAETAITGLMNPSIALHHAMLL